ncbi:hypothetical protein PSTG_07447 [Puccinia striiformis f. sp. tritici PST-78]|nr:hypothetical protein PSTG_07447 [Puccinia striiformis f. sp. tritici PST-78]
MEEHFNNYAKFNYRDHDQIRIRWTLLNTATLKFSAIYNAIFRMPPSGYNDAMIMAAAIETYAKRNKDVAFSSVPAWEILRHTPKWRPDRPNLTIPIPTDDMNTSDEIDIGDGSISSNGTMLGIVSPSNRSASSINRPIGGKAAKKRQINGYQNAEMLSEASKFNSSSADWLTALKVANAILKEKNSLTKG